MSSSSFVISADTMAMGSNKTDITVIVIHPMHVRVCCRVIVLLFIYNYCKLHLQR